MGAMGECLGVAGFGLGFLIFFWRFRVGVSIFFLKQSMERERGSHRARTNGFEPRTVLASHCLGFGDEGSRSGAKVDERDRTGPAVEGFGILSSGFIVGVYARETERRQ